MKMQKKKKQLENINKTPWGKKRKAILKIQNDISNILIL